MSKTEKNKKILERKERAGYNIDVPDSCRICHFFRPGVKGSTKAVDSPFCENPGNLFHIQPQAICDYYVPKN